MPDSINYYRGNFCIEVKPAPGSLVIFGASGDLARRKLYPALFHLFRRGLLHEESRIVGCSRTDYSDDAFRDHLRTFLSGGSEDEKTAFLEKAHYLPGDYGDADFYGRLDRFLDGLEAKSDLPANRTFYLAMDGKVFDVANQRGRIFHFSASAWAMNVACNSGERSMKREFQPQTRI